MREFVILDKGLIAYAECHALQKDLLEKRIRRQIADTLVLCEHPQVVTMGRAKGNDSLLVSRDFLKQKNIEFLFVERGGDITCHCPGQIVVYPVFDLYEKGRDVHKFLHSLEEVIILTLREYGFDGRRRKGNAGIWVSRETGDEEIGFIGIALKKWVVYHGFSFNVNPNLDFFSMINPCGISGARATSLSSLADREDVRVEMDKVKNSIVRNFESVFGLSGKYA